MEKDINTEVSNTQLPATEEKANLKESLRIQKSQWIKEQIKRQREAEDAVLEQMIEEQCKRIGICRSNVLLPTF